MPTGGGGGVLSLCPHREEDAREGLSFFPKSSSPVHEGSMLTTQPPPKALLPHLYHHPGGYVPTCELEGRGQSILKQISPEYSLKEQMLKLKLQYLGHLVQTADCLFGKDPDAGKD